jgi:hypothetical protein
VSSAALPKTPACHRPPRPTSHTWSKSPNATTAGSSACHRPGQRDRRSNSVWWETKWRRTPTPGTCQSWSAITRLSDLANCRMLVRPPCPQDLCCRPDREHLGSAVGGRDGFVHRSIEESARRAGTFV